MLGPQLYAKGPSGAIPKPGKDAIVSFYFRVLGWESDDLRRIAGDLVLLITYSSFFALVTQAFLVLGLREYLRAKVKAAS